MKKLISKKLTVNSPNLDWNNYLKKNFKIKFAFILSSLF
jgi:hypothetical protein